MSFSTRQALDLATLFGTASAREGLVFARSVTIVNEAGASVSASAVPSDPYDRSDASRSQSRMFRFLDSVTIKRNYKITETTNGETATWWVKDVRDDNEGTLYAKCERPIAKG